MIHGEAVPPFESEFEYNPNWGGPAPVFWISPAWQPNHNNLRANTLAPAGLPSATWTGSTVQRNVLTSRGRAFTFNGTDDALTATMAGSGITVNTPRTFMFWAEKPADVNELDGVLGWGTGAAQIAVVYFDQDTYGGLLAGQQASSTLTAKLATGISIADRHQYLVVYAGGATSPTIYVDGRANSTPVTASLAGWSSSLTLGKGFASGYHAACRIGDFAVWAAALSAQQAWRLYTSSLDGSPGCMARTPEPQWFPATVAPPGETTLQIPTLQIVI